MFVCSRVFVDRIMLGRPAHELWRREIVGGAHEPDGKLEERRQREEPCGSAGACASPVRLSEPEVARPCASPGKNAKEKRNGWQATSAKERRRRKSRSPRHGHARDRALFVTALKCRPSCPLARCCQRSCRRPRQLARPARPSLSPEGLPGLGCFGAGEVADRYRIAGGKACLQSLV